MNGLRLACVCGQRGSAAALMPVLKEGGDLNWQIHTLAYGEAAVALQLENVPMELCKPKFGEEEAIRWLTDTSAEVVLLGTDATRHVEKRVARAAKALGIPSIMFVDFWSNYAERFEDDKGRIVSDAVAVLDAEMACSLETYGIPKEHLHVTGSPALEQAVLLADLEPGKIYSLRAAMGLPSDSVCVLFVSSPASSLDFGDGPAVTRRPHSLLPALHDLANALDCCEELTGRSVQLIVRPHPREAASLFNDIRCKKVAVRVETGYTGLDWVAISDLVVGLDTMLLVEAMMARRSVLCLAYARPVIPAVRALAESIGGLVCKQADLTSAISLVFSPDSTIESFSQGSRLQTLAHGATKRMIALVTEFAHTRVGRMN